MTRHLVRLLASHFALLALPTLLAAVDFGTTSPAPRPHAVVLLIGDGFGISQLTLARRAMAGPHGRLALERLPVVGLVTTASDSNAVTDSGAAATAFAGGVKTDNRVIGLDPHGEPVESIGTSAQRHGWRVGYVTTTRVTHATPAAFYAHVADRYADEGKIARQLLAQRPDVVLGGGLTFFVPASQGGESLDDFDLLADARAAGFTVLRRGDALVAPTSGPLLGLFANSHLAYALDEGAFPPERRDPSLAALTQLALAALSADGSSFFLMVEGGRIDHAGHDFDAAGVVAETRTFDAAVAEVLAFQRRHPDTVVVLTADHATGGLAINDFSKWPALTRQSASVAWMTSQVRNAGAGADLLARHTGFDDFTAQEIELIRAPAASAYEANRRLGAMLAARHGFTFVPRVDLDDTQGHTGEDVAIFAGGPGAESFGGMLDNTDIPRRIAALLGWSLDGR